MASASSEANPQNAERRKRVFLGRLPPDFLRITTTPKQQQEAADQQAAWALHQQYLGSSILQNTIGRLNITVAQAKLVKNYGMTRMDPYARIRVGHCVLETQTDPKGGKTPHWNKVVQCPLPQGVNSIYVEIYDECSFMMDELIAWTHIPIPKNVFSGETTEDWYPLNGKQGEGKEGMLNLVLSFSSGGGGGVGRGGPGCGVPLMMVPSTGQNLLGMPQFAQVPVYTQLAPPPPPPVAPLNPQHLSQIEEMFPNIDKEVVKSVYEANRGNKEITVNSLLQMTSET